jgi:predicted RND superfamily exporter protein
VAYEAFRQQFGQDELALIAVRPPQIFDRLFLERLRSLQNDLEREVPHLQDVSTLINARSTRGSGDELIVEDLFATWPKDEDALAALRDRALATPLYRNTILSRHYTYTMVSVRPRVHVEPASADEVLGDFDDGAPQATAALLSDEQTHEFLAAVQRVVARHDSPDFKLETVGGLVTNQHLNEMLEHDVALFVVGAVILMAAILWVLFRTWLAVVVPLCVVLLSMVATLGSIVMIDIPISVTLQLMPILMLTVGVCNAVHVLAMINHQLAAGMPKGEAIATSIGNAGLPMLLTTLTTTAGFLSFASAEIAPVSHLGIVAPIGVMLSFVYTIIVLPALLALPFIRMRADQPGRAREQALGEFMGRVGGVAARHPWAVIGVWTALSLLAIAGLFELRVSQDALRWFPAHDPVRQAQEELDREFAGTTTLEIVVDSGSENGLYDPALLERLERAVAFVQEYQHGPIVAGKVLTILDVIKETNQALHENDPKYYAIPKDRELIAQELLLFENSGSDDVEDLVDSQFRFARISIRLPLCDAILYTAFLTGLEQGLRERLGPDVGIESTGIMQLLTRTMAGVLDSMIRSYFTAILVITPLMIFLIGSLRLGLLAMIPNLLPVLLLLGVMGWLDIPIDMSSMLVGSIIIGLSDDDTIHFMHRYRRSLAESGEARAAVEQTLRATGGELLFSSLILGWGFVVMEFAYMRNAAQFGQLACFATVTAFVVEIMLAPALLVLAGGRRSARIAGAPA